MPSPLTATFRKIDEALSRSQRVLVVSHDRPDGDAIGSTVATGFFLDALGKEVQRVNADPVPASLRFLPGTEAIRSPDAIEAPDLVIALDSAERDRISERVWSALPNAVPVINIDHHVSNSRFGDIDCVDPDSPATGQILAELAGELDWPLSREAADNLYAAISTDTGSFRYPHTTAATHRIAATLVGAGVDVGLINQQLYESHPLRRVEALQHLLGSLRLDFGGRCASITLPRAVSQRLELEPDDTEGAIDLIRSIDSVEVAVFFEEKPDGTIRVSSRSKKEKFSVGEICARFGGGGHTLAAGARLPGPLEAAIDRFLDAVGRVL